MSNQVKTNCIADISRASAGNSLYRVWLEEIDAKSEICVMEYVSSRYYDYGSFLPIPMFQLFSLGKLPSQMEKFTDVLVSFAQDKSPSYSERTPLAVRRHDFALHVHRNHPEFRDFVRTREEEAQMQAWVKQFSEKWDVDAIARAGQRLHVDGPRQKQRKKVGIQ